MSVVSQLYPRIAIGASAKLFKSQHVDYADGQQVRDFVWVGDVADVMWFYRNRDKSGIFNVGTGEGETFETMVNALSQATGRDRQKSTMLICPKG